MRRRRAARKLLAVSQVADSAGVLQVFGPATGRWFSQSFPSPTEVQKLGWPRIAAGEHALLLAPTGSGKTLAAFLSCIDRLIALPPAQREQGVRVLYVSPLKALAYDIERNLRAPLIGIGRAARDRDEQLVVPRVDIRSGDTSQKERRRQAKEPAEILVTTPESLYLILGSQSRDRLRTVETVIVDEVHALAPTKRGAHLAVSLERLCALADGEPQRIGLSATARPIDEVARFVGGDRPVAVVDASSPPLLELQVMVPVPDMTRPERRRDGEQAPLQAEEAPSGDEDDDVEPAPKPAQHGIWPVIVPELLQLIRAHRTTIIFVNSRGMCERLVQHINELAETPLVRAHHGSLAQGHRREVEEMLKGGRIPCIVATSSLELGIDMGAVDLVVMVESPGAVARGLQRVGRAGHGVGEISKGRIFPKHRGDLLEATVVAQRMRAGQLEPLRVPRNPLDVLAQQVVAMCSLEPQAITQIERVVRRAANFAELPKDAFIGVLDMLSGRYPSTDFSELRPRLTWDRQADELSARRGTRMLAIISGGTIPDRGLYRVQLGPDGPRVGELDEEMVHETQPGNIVTLGASSWRVEAITRDRVIVAPAPGEPGRMPFWRGAGPGRPIELGRALGAFLRELSEQSDSQAHDNLVQHYQLPPLAAENLLRFLREQRQQTGALPTDRAITVERFQDELGDYRICILSPFGGRVHAPWSLALEARFADSTGLEVQTMWGDDGICIRLVDAEELPELPSLFPDPEQIEELVVEQLGHSALFASHFRENAARALLLPRRRPGSRTPLWQQRLKSQQLLRVAQSFPSFPIVVETYRECLQDVFDMPSLCELMSRVRSRKVRVDEAVTPSASPFARSLVFAFVATYLYEGDSPIAERRAQALSLDRNLLRELLGQEELRELLDPEVIEQVEAELQHLSETRRVGHLDALHDMLRQLGGLSREEIRARSSVEVAPLLAELQASRRVVEMTIAGNNALLAVEDVALYRDALGAAPPLGLPDAHLEARAQPLLELLARYARTHGPFTARDLAHRHGLLPAAVEPALAQLEAADKLVRGEFLRAGKGEEWCDPHVLRRIKRRTLARLRGEVEPVDRATFARFLPAWHGVVSPHRSTRREPRAALEAAIVQLEGMPLSYAELERSILPARVPAFQPRLLDELGAMGFVSWIGCGALGSSDGRVALYRRTQVSSLVEPVALLESVSVLGRRIVSWLEQRGACFFEELLSLEQREEQESAPAGQEEMLETLWDLVWAGLVTNDTFQPLRALGMRRSKPRSRPSRRSKARGDLRTAGRWSLVAQLISTDCSPTERLHARALMLLERHGIVSREAIDVEHFSGGFSAVYPVLRAMEEAGKIRRGYFVEGIGGAQFAFPGAVDRLRSMKEPPAEPQITILSAADPANPYGWIVPWPEQPDTATRPPKRNSGATLVLVDGEPTLFLDRGGHVLLTFESAAESGALSRGFEALRDMLARRSRKTIRIDSIDGQPALRSAHAPLLRRLGVSFDHKGLVIEREV